jgi:hypothetical protein
LLAGGLIGNFSGNVTGVLTLAVVVSELCPICNGNIEYQEFQIGISGMDFMQEGSKQFQSVSQ